MGHAKHHAIIVTTWKEEGFRDLEFFLATLGCRHSIQDGFSINGYRSAVVWPDGSNEGWADSDEGDAIRDKLVEWLRTQCNVEDGSSWFEWVEVGYSSDSGTATVERMGVN